MSFQFPFDVLSISFTFFFDLACRYNQLQQQSFNVQQVAFQHQQIKSTVETVAAMKDGMAAMKKDMKPLRFPGHASTLNRIHVIVWWQGYWQAGVDDGRHERPHDGRQRGILSSSPPFPRSSSRRAARDSAPSHPTRRQVQECLGRSYDLGDEVTEEDLDAELAMCVHAFHPAAHVMMLAVTCAWQVRREHVRGAERRGGACTGRPKESAQLLA
jgi:hypothetical protein